MVQLEKLVQFEHLRRIAGLAHGVTERDTSLPLDFSLAYHTGEEPEAVHANRSALEAWFGKQACFVSALQVHGDHVHVVEGHESRGWAAVDHGLQADALVTNVERVVLTILTADCVPILLYDPSRRAIGAIHAGWKGTQLEIVRKTIDKMSVLYGSDPKDILAGIGPSIGGCCYEVGGEVAEHFVAYPDAIVSEANGAYLLDLKAVNASQLEMAGLQRTHIEISSVCTACEHRRFFSYRAEKGTAGRFMSYIMLGG
jgi:YfiH family protein